jgi:hypothetical protein
MKTLRMLAGLALAVAVPFSALAQISDADAGAMKKLAWHNLAEIDAGKLAASKKDVEETADIAGKAQDAEFKAAVQANAKIKEHLQMAQDLARSAASGESAR